MIELKTCKNKAFENALGTDDGWENCHKPITNIFVGQKILSEIKNGNFRVVFDEPETCDQCFGRQKAVFCEVTIDSIVYQALQCRDCGIRSYRPVLFGVVMSTHEKFLEE